MNAAPESQPISTLKTQTAKLIKRLERSGAPVILTRQGKPKAVIQDAAAYQELVDVKERLDTILSIRRGFRDFRSGRFKPAGEVFDRLEKKHDL